MQTDFVEGAKNVEARFADRLGERAREWAVAATAILRNVSWLGGERNQCALRCLHLRKPARRRAQAPSAERIVTAGVENDEIEPRARPFHLAQHEIGVEHLEIDIGLLGRVGADRHEVIRTAHLHAVSGIVEQTDIRPLQLRPETLHRAIETRLVEIELRTTADQREAERAQGLRHQLGVVGWIFEPRHMLVGGVADDERHALFRMRWHQRHCERTAHDCDG